MRFKGVILDLDNTIYSYAAAHQPALQATLMWLSKLWEIPVTELKTAYDQARAEINAQLNGFAASHSRLLYFQRLCENLQKSPYELALLAEDLYWRAFLENMVLRPQCLEFLQFIKPLPVIVVTDLTSQIQLRKIVTLGLQDYLSGMVTSEEAGYEKPHPRIFELASKKLGINIEDVCMIGDSWEKDILGALRFNLHCYWYREEQESGDAQLNSIAQTPQYSLVHKFSGFGDLIHLVDPIV